MKTLILPFLVTLLIVCPGISIGQINDATPARNLVVNGIYIAGNNKTKTQIIRREIPFKTGDTLSTSILELKLTQAKENIYNTKLFLSVDATSIPLNDSTINVYVFVKERWYTFPLPYIELADRSFNVWLHTYHASLRRLNYGIYFMQQNLSGRNDELDIKATAGFNKQLKAEYTTPYLNTEMTRRLRLGGGVLFSNEIPYKSSDANKLLYFQSTKPIRKEWYVSVGYLSRKYIRKREWITLSFHHIDLFDSIRFYNPKYFAEGKTQVFYPEFQYKFRYDEVDNSMYPLQGASYEAIVTKRGIGWNKGANLLQLEGHTSFYNTLGKGWYTELQLGGQIKLPFEQPYFNTLALGYGENYLRGYEYYVINGVAFFTAKADLKKRLVHFEVPTLLNSRNYSRIPFTLYAKVYSDAGSVYSKTETLLGNKFLWTGGIGLDIVTLYDISLSINFSFNNLSEKGFFFHASR